MTGLAIDPGDPERVVALGEQGAYTSRDGGVRWRPLSLPGGLVTWTQEVGIVAVDFGGVLRRAEDPNEEFGEVGTLDGSPAALEGAGEEILAATHDSRVLSSRDGGETWTELLGP